MRLTRVFSVVALLCLVFVSPAFAAAESGGVSDLSALAAGIGIAIAAFGGALGQGRTASAALESIGRNPGAAGQLFTPMLLGLVLIESLVIYALVIALKLVGIF